jgi:hypothetical protein
MACNQKKKKIQKTTLMDCVKEIINVYDDGMKKRAQQRVPGPSSTTIILC